MGRSYFASAKDKIEHEKELERRASQEEARIADGRKKIAAKIVMAVVDQVVNQIIRPGPKPEERECYEMAGELRATVPDLEKLAKKIIDVNDGIE